MADELDFDSKTEPPSPRRREQAREKGQFAHSTDLNSGLILFLGVAGVLVLAQGLGNGLLAQTHADLLGLSKQDFSAERVQELAANKFSQAVTIVGLLIGLLFVCTLTINLAQVGFNLNVDRLAFNWEKIAPYHFDRLMSWANVVRGLVLSLKILAIAGVAWWVLRRRGLEITHINETSLAVTLGHAWDFMIRIALSLAATLLLIGMIDYGYQLWRFERSLYMTKEELKEEFKREEGNPQIKARVRKLQRENARRKMFHQVPKATVIVTNPTHLAIALRYELGVMTAPKVIAKGADHVAKRIVEIARENGVPVIERKSLAQALYKSVKIDQDIPLELYFVVAELMTYVYQLKGNAPREGAQ